MSDDSVNNEELSAFVASTLKAIADGVQVASECKATQQRDGHSTFKMPDSVSFDVAVTARSTGETGGGLKLKVFDVGAEAGGKLVSESESISRIRFDVPWGYIRTTPMTKTVPGGY